MPPRSAPPVRIGTAGWSVPRDLAHLCRGSGTHLERYARVLSCAEINSSFHRPHSSATFARWAATTPPGFQFSVKMPRTITHEQKLRRARVLLTRFLEETSGLGDTRGPVLIQLPPSLVFERRVATRFFLTLREQWPGWVVCEPRHPSWFTASADQLLHRHQVSRAAADPPRVEGGDLPGGWRGAAYFRLHGSPRAYWSRYSQAYLDDLALTLRSVAASDVVWVIFDNTASGAAFGNACELQEALGAQWPVSS